MHISAILTAAIALDPNADHTHFIVFELWDEDSLKEDEFIGYFLIPIASIGDSKVASSKYKLGQRSSEKSQGAVYVSYQLLVSIVHVVLWKLVASKYTYR